MSFFVRIIRNLLIIPVTCRCQQFAVCLDHSSGDRRKSEEHTLYSKKELNHNETAACLTSTTIWRFRRTLPPFYLPAASYHGGTILLHQHKTINHAQNDWQVPISSRTGGRTQKDTIPTQTVPDYSF
jgi:hypothetical protein